jgi:hypothetical protein
LRQVGPIDQVLNAPADDDVLHFLRHSR